MSHYTVLVIGPDVEKQMAPYDENTAEAWFGTTEAGRDAKWDWYVEGGRWKDFLLLRDGTRANSAPKGQVDFVAMRHQAETEAAARWVHMEAVTVGVPDPETFDVIRERYPDDIGKARDAYWSQPWIQRIRTDEELRFYEPSDFGTDRAAYIKRSGDNAISFHAWLRNGEWHERGEMGWFAFVSDEKDHDAWFSEMVAVIESLPDDEILTVIDAHI